MIIIPVNSDALGNEVVHHSHADGVVQVHHDLRAGVAPVNEVMHGALLVGDVEGGFSVCGGWKIYCRSQVIYDPCLNRPENDIITRQ